MDALINKVLARQPEAARRFPLLTAILERLSGPLSDAVRSGFSKSPSSGQSILEYLEQANLFCRAAL